MTWNKYSYVKNDHISFIKWKYKTNAFPQVKDIKHDCAVLDEPRFIKHVKIEELKLTFL